MSHVERSKVREAFARALQLAEGDTASAVEATAAVLCIPAEAVRECVIEEQEPA